MNDPLLAEPMRSRWSPSVFDPGHTLAAEQIRALLTAAQWAPSAGNRQPWAFLLAERGSRTHEVLLRHLSRGNSRWVPRASVVFVTAVRPDEDRDPAYAFHDLGQAAAHLTLQAQAMGLAAHQFTGFDRDRVAAELGVPEGGRVMSGIAVGVRGDPEEMEERDRERDRRVRTRRPLHESAFGDGWGRPWRGLVG